MPSRRVSAAELHAWQNLIRTASHLLQRRPAALFQEAANQPAAAAPSRAARSRLEAGLERRPWLRQERPAEAASPCRMTLAGHSRPLTCCAFSPDGARIVSGSADGTLRLWDGRTGRPLAQLGGHGHGGIARCAFSPDGSLILSAVGEITDIAKRYPNLVGDISLWDGLTGSHVRSFPAGPQSLGAITACSFSPDGTRILAGGGEYSPGWLKVWMVASGEELLSLGGAQTLASAAWSPAGDRIAAGWRSENALHLLAADSGCVLRSLATGSYSPLGCAWSPDGRWILCYNWGRLWFWEAGTGRVIAAAEPRLMYLAGSAISQDGQRAVSWSGQDGKAGVTLWQADTGSELAWLGKEGTATRAALFAPEGARLAVAYGDGTISLRNAGDGAELAELTGHGASVSACAFSPDGGTLVSAAGDNTLKLWDLAAVVAGGSARSAERPEGTLAVCADGRLATATYDPESRHHVIRRWDADRGLLDSTLRVSHQYEDCIGLTRFGYTGPGSSLRGWDFSPDGRLCASWGSKYGWRPDLVLWDASTGEKICDLEGHREMVSEGGFSPDGRLLVTSDKLELCVWDPAARALIVRLPGRSFVEFCPGDGRLLTRAGSNLLELIDVQGQSSAVSVGDASWVHALSPDGNLLAVRHSWRNSLRLCSTLTGEVQVELDVGPHCQACRFLPDGRYLATADDDAGTITIWELAKARSVLTLPGAIPLAFSPDGRWLACAGGQLAGFDGERWLTLRDARRGALVAEHHAGGQVRSIIWRADSRRLVVAGAAGRISFLTLENVTNTDPATLGGVP